MAATHVIARAAWGQPMSGYIVHATSGLAYFAADDWLDAVMQGESEPVGYPIEDVFAHDLALWGELQSALRHGDPQALQRAWAKAEPARLPH